MPFGVEDEEVEPSSVEMGDEVRTGFFFLICAGMVWSTACQEEASNVADTESVGLQA